RAWPGVPGDPVGRREDALAAAGCRRAGQGAPGDSELPAVRGGDRADRGGERGDLRGPAGSAACGRRGSPSCGRGKRGLRAALAAQASAEVGRLAEQAARSLGCDAGLEAAEAVIRAGVLKLGGGVLEQLLAADPGY